MTPMMRRLPLRFLPSGDAVMQSVKTSIIRFIIRKMPAGIVRRIMKIGMITPKCDACGWTGEPHGINDAYLKSMMGFRCPQCNHIVISRDDIDMMRSLVQRIGCMEPDSQAKRITLTVNNRKL